MKSPLLIFLLIFGLTIACKKENSKFSRFKVDFANLNDSIYYDSVSYALINYSDLSELKDTAAIKNPDIFSHSEKIEKQIAYGVSPREFGITWTAEHTYVIKKFDLVSKSGNIIFYVPYSALYYVRNGAKYPSPFRLPFPVKAFDGSMAGIYVAKK
jgi:hypothetical protein